MDSRRRQRSRWRTFALATASRSSRSTRGRAPDARVFGSREDGFKFWLILLRVVTIYSPLRIFVPISLLLLAGGVGYALWTIATQLNVTNTSVLLTVTGVLVFLIGLVSDQIATLRLGLGGRDDD